VVIGEVTAIIVLNGLDSAISREPGEFRGFPTTRPRASLLLINGTGATTDFWGEAADAADSYENPEDAVGCTHD